MPYRRCGRSGLVLPRVSLGLWQNFGDDRPLERQPGDRPARLRPRRSRTSTWPTTTGRRTARPRRPSASCCGDDFGRTATSSSSRRRPATTCGPGPYGDWGSRKYLLASLDQSLRRMGLEYVDIFYSHRFDPDTPLEETMGALDTAVRQGKALYVGISSYSAEQTRGRRAILRDARDAAPDPPAVLLDAQPLDRGRSARRARRARHRLHRLLAARAGRCSPTGTSTAIPEGSRASRELDRSRRTCSTERDAGEDRGAERDRRAARPDARADGDRVDAARPAGHLRADRRVQRRAARGERRGARPPRVLTPTSSPRSTATRPRARSTSGSRRPSGNGALTRGPRVDDGPRVSARRDGTSRGSPP